MPAGRGDPRGRSVTVEETIDALEGGVGVGGVLEPVNARPVIVEDGAFIGSRCILTEGVRICERAVLAPNVSLTASVPIIDVTGPERVEYRGYVPPNAIVVPGTR